MNYQDYVMVTTNRAIEAIEQGKYDHSGPRLFDYVFEEMRIDDAITGDATGSFLGDPETAKQACAELVFDPKFLQHLERDDAPLEIFMRGPEAVDVAARCFALSDAYDRIEGVWNEHCEELIAEEERGEEPKRSDTDRAFKDRTQSARQSSAAHSSPSKAPVKEQGLEH